MAFSTFIMILIALTTCRCSNADTNDFCEEPSPTNAPTKICINKPSNFDKLRNKMDELIEQIKDWNGFKPQPIERNELNVRFGRNKQNCEPITTLEQPYMLKTNGSLGISTDYVVQSKYFKQEIKYTRCSNLNGSCFEDIKGSTTQTSCAEKYGAVSVYIYDHNLHKLVYKTVNLPVCCFCKIDKS